MVSQIRTSFLFKMRLPTRPAPSRVSDESCRRPPRGPPRAVMAARLRDLGLAEHRSLGRPYSYFILLWLPHRGCLGADPICPVSLRDRLHCFQCFLLSLRRNSHNTNFTLCSAVCMVQWFAVRSLCCASTVSLQNVRFPITRGCLLAGVSSPSRWSPGPGGVGREGSFSVAGTRGVPEWGKGQLGTG